MASASPLDPSKTPIDALRASEQPAVLAVITGVEGPSYRPLGALMAIFADGSRAGTLSSGCIEADLTMHALQALEAGTPRSIRYGRGSPFMDIQLPCGGGLEILLLPNPDRDVIAALSRSRAARKVAVLRIHPQSGALSLQQAGQTGPDGAHYLVRFEPDLRFVVFGKGPEATSFSALVHSIGYPCLLISPDPETLATGTASGCATRQILAPDFPADLAADPWTAVLLFFHDHDWEPPILRGALQTPAVYIGAQGSQRARDTRLMALQQLGVSADDLARLRGPIGLVPSARDARTLSVSVLAEVLATMQPPSRG